MNMALPAEAAASFTPEAYALAAQWGWSEPPDQVMARAERWLELKGHKHRDIAVALELISPDEADALIAKKDKATRPLDALAASSARVERDKLKICAIQTGMEFFDDLEDKHIVPHADLKDQAVAQACDKYGAAFITIQGSTPVLVFGDYESGLRRFEQTSGAERTVLHKKYHNLTKALADNVKIRSFMGEATRRGEGAGAGGEENRDIVFAAQLREENTLRKLANIMELAISANASDIHIDPNSDHKVLLFHRVMGDLEQLPDTMSIEEYHEIKQFLVKRSGASIKYERMKDPKDGMFQYVGRRTVYVRCSFIPLSHSGSSQNDLVSLCLRLIPQERGAVSLEEKGVVPEVVAFMRNAITPDAGIVLLIGATGSGKSTTLSGMIGLHHDIHGTKKMRLSIEDPVERFLPGITQIQVPYHQRGKSTAFSTILRNLLRHDPNLIWLGEIRDAETAETAIQAASTGHLLLSTIHSESVTQATERLANMIPPERADLRNSMIENLSLLVCQRLAKEVCPHCSKWANPTEAQAAFVAWLQRLKGVEIRLPTEVKVANRSGCDWVSNDGKVRCRNGFIGRVPVNEILNITKEVREVLMGEARERFSKIGSLVDITMENAVLKLIKDGRCEVDALRP